MFHAEWAAEMIFQPPDALVPVGHADDSAREFNGPYLLQASEQLSPDTAKCR